MKSNKFFKIIVAVAVSEAAGAIGSSFMTSDAMMWYRTMTKPPLTPPDWTFGIVWTVLFLLMGIAAGIIWARTPRWLPANRAATVAIRTALTIFIGQLALNVLWSAAFFGFQSPFWAFIDLSVLWLAIFATIIHFGRLSKTAAALLVPYILWVSFAGFLNYSYADRAVSEIQGPDASTPLPAYLLTNPSASKPQTFDGKNMKIVVNGMMTRYFGNEARGDLNYDGIDDFAFLIEQDGADGEASYYAVVALATGAGYTLTAPYFIGSGIAPQSTSIDGEMITVNYATNDAFGSTDRTNQPSNGVSLYLIVASDGTIAEAL